MSDAKFEAGLRSSSCTWPEFRQLHPATIMNAKVQRLRLWTPMATIKSAQHPPIHYPLAACFITHLLVPSGVLFASISHFIALLHRTSPSRDSLQDVDICVL